MTDQTPTDPIRDEAVRVLAEALEQCIGMLRRRPEKAQAVANAILDASPTLARRLALGTALDAAGTIDVGAALAAKLGSGK